MNLKRALKAVLREINFGRVEHVTSPSTATMNLLDGRVAFISGGTGGIGKSIAKRFLQAGCKVIISGTSLERVNSVVEELNSPVVRGMVLNLNNSEEIERTAKATLNVFPGSPVVDILVNAAGTNTNNGDVLSQGNDDWDQILGINLKGTFFLTQAFATQMIKYDTRGNILNISSSSALRPAWGAYEISKWGIKGFTLGAADTLIKYGIVVNAIGPGPTATPMLGKTAGERLDLPDNPSGRYALPEEIAEAALMLVSNSGRMIVGDTLYITGGAGTICIDR